MEKYKICPLCGEKNTTSLMECSVCEADLTRVKTTDFHADNTSEKPKEKAELLLEKKQSEKAIIRLCLCGFKNPPSARKCGKCGDDIADIIPFEKTVIKSNQSVQNEYLLSAVGGDYVFIFMGENTIIGREQGMNEYLCKKTFVSRKHAELITENEKLYIKNLSNTNFTYINNEKIPSGTKYLLNDGDEIGLGGFVDDKGQRQTEAAYFIVRVN